MRIVSGQLGGRRLVNPPRRGVRPTAERVRAAFFDALGDRIVEGAFLDLCAGTGAMALEAFSRGAPEITLVEKDRAAFRTIVDNIAKLGLEGDPRIRPVRRDVARWLNDERGGKGRAGAFSVVYFDPPYAERAAGRWLEILAQSELLAPDALVAVEQSGRQVVDAPSFTQVRRRTYGETVISLLALDRP